MEFQEGLPGLIFNSQQRVHSWATQASSPQLGTRPGKAPDGDWQCWLSVLSTLHPALGPLFWTSAPLLQNGGGMFYELPPGYNNGTDTYFCLQLCDFGQMACPS